MVAEAYLLGICATVGVGARLGSAGSAVMGWRSRGGGVYSCLVDLAHT